MRFNAPPNWPPAPAGCTPPPGRQPNPAWGAPPTGWQLWIPDAPARHGPPPTPPPMRSHGQIPDRPSFVTGAPVAPPAPPAPPRAPSPFDAEATPNPHAPAQLPPHAPSPPAPNAQGATGSRRSNGRSPAMQNTMRALGILGTILMGILTVLGWLLDKIEAAFIIAIGVGAAYFAITIPVPELWFVTLLAAGALFLNLVLDITFF